MILLLLLFVVLVILFIFIKIQYSFWERNGIAYIKPSFPFGNLKDVFKKQKSFGVALYHMYKETSEPFIGIYLFYRPAILIRDPELVKAVLVKDFQYFHDRGMYYEPKTDPMSASLLTLPGAKWKHSRMQITPAFSSAKLKGMFDNISMVGGELVKLMEPMAVKEETIEIRTIIGRYVADCLALIAFGLHDVSTLKNPDHEFLMNAKNFNDGSRLVTDIRKNLTMVHPKLMKYIGMKRMPPYMQDFCLRLVTDTIKRRETETGIYKDLMQFFIQLRNNNGTGEFDSWNIKLDSKNEKVMSYEEIAGQVFAFYMAGSSTSTSVVAYTLYELTQNVDLMKRATEDVRTTLEKHNGQLTYESLNEMKFIELCTKEALRKYPFPMLDRVCSKDYKIHGTNTVIRKGTQIYISVLGLHRDKQHFPEPEKFLPDRFIDEKYANSDDLYMPFGMGPRNCVAFRMGLLVSKVAIVLLLANFKLEAVTKKELEFDSSGISLLPKAGQCKIKIAKKNVLDFH